MVEGEVLVFIEVKTRAGRAGEQLVFESLTSEQERTIRATAKRYIKHRLGKKWRGEYRFDAVGIVLEGGAPRTVKHWRGFC